MACICGDAYCPSCGPAQGIPQYCGVCYKRYVGPAWNRCECPGCDLCEAVVLLNDEGLCADCVADSMEAMHDEIALNLECFWRSESSWRFTY